MQAIGLSWLGLGVDDLAATVPFFRDVIGIKLLGVYGDGSAKLLVTGGQVLEIFGSASGGRKSANPQVVGVEVDDIRGTRAELQDHGMELIGDLVARNGC